MKQKEKTVPYMEGASFLGGQYMYMSCKGLRIVWQVVLDAFALSNTYCTFWIGFHKDPQ